MPGLQLMTDVPTQANQAAYDNEVAMWSGEWQTGIGAAPVIDTSDPSYKPTVTSQLPGGGGSSVGSQVAAGIQAAGSAFRDVMSVLKPTQQPTPQPQPQPRQESWFSKNWQLLAILGGTAAVLGLLTIALKRDKKGR